MAPFPLWVEHHPEEPSYALLQRTMERNLVKRPGLVWAALGRRGAMRASTVSPVDVAAVCHASPSALALSSPKRDGGDVLLFGGRIAVRHFTVASRRWCPGCLREDPVHRSWWDVPAVTCCPRHLTRICERCVCGRSLVWGSDRISQCRCGLELSETPSERVDSATARGSAYVVSRLLGDAIGDLPLFAGSELSETIDALYRLGMFAVDARKPLKVLRTEVGEERLLNEGLQVAAGFPEAFVDCLDSALAAADGEPGTFGARRAYGDVLFSWLSRYRKTKPGRMIAEVARRHAGRHILVRQGFDLLGAKPELDRVSLKEAAERCRISFDRMRRIAIARGLVRPEARPGVPHTMSTVEFRSIETDLESYVGSTALAAALSLKHEDLLEVVRAGHLVPVVPPLGLMRQDTPTTFRRSAADDLLRMLGKGRVPVGAPEGTIPLPRAAATMHISTCELIGRILDGEISIEAFDPSREGVKSLRVRATGWRAKLRFDRLGMVTVAEFADKHRLHGEMVRRLVLAGAIPHRTVGAKRMIVEADASEFFASHVGPKEAAAMLGVSYHRVIEHLSKHGVLPAWRKEEVRRTFFRKRDVERLAGSQVVGRAGDTARKNAAAN